MANVQPAFPHVVLDPTATQQLGLEPEHGDQGSRFNQAVFESQPNIILPDSINSPISSLSLHSPASVLLPGDMDCDIIITDLVDASQDIEEVAATPTTHPLAAAYNNVVVWLDYPDTPQTSPDYGDRVESIPESISDSISEHVPQGESVSAYVFYEGMELFYGGMGLVYGEVDPFLGDMSDYNSSDTVYTYISSRRSGWASESDVASDGYDGGSESNSVIAADGEPMEVEVRALTLAYSWGWNNRFDYPGMGRGERERRLF
jgi:hypothetical protein